MTAHGWGDGEWGDMAWGSGEEYPYGADIVELTCVASYGESVGKPGSIADTVSRTPVYRPTYEIAGTP